MIPPRSCSPTALPLGGKPDSSAQDLGLRCGTEARPSARHRVVSMAGLATELGLPWQTLPINGTTFTPRQLKAAKNTVRAGTWVRVRLSQPGRTASRMMELQTPQGEGRAGWPRGPQKERVMHVHPGLICQALSPESAHSSDAGIAHLRAKVRTWGPGRCFRLTSPRGPHTHTSSEDTSLGTQHRTDQTLLKTCPGAAQAGRGTMGGRWRWCASAAQAGSQGGGRHLLFAALTDSLRCECSHFGPVQATSVAPLNGDLEGMSHGSQ